MTRYLPTICFLAAALASTSVGSRRSALASAATTEEETADDGDGGVDRMSRMGGTVESRLSDLVAFGSLNSEQLAFLVAEYGKSVAGSGQGGWSNRERERPGRNFDADLVRAYLKTETEKGTMTQETAEYVGNVLHVGGTQKSSAAQQNPSSLLQSGPAPTSYEAGTNGIVTLLGRWGDAFPVRRCSSTSNLYNGIWGVKLGEREYALQCSSSGLNVVDVTDPSSPYRVQEITMNSRVVWRDVVTYTTAGGVTYAYVAADGGDDFYVVDLSNLSTSAGAGDGVDSDPILSSRWAKVEGYTDDGHTVSIDEDAGLLFLNGATGSRGCHILDLNAGPWDNPPLLASWDGSYRDCHDSFARGGRLYSADGYSDRIRVVDIAAVRSGTAPAYLGESSTSTGGYAHSAWLTDDSSYMFAFEEDNNVDITVYDMSDPDVPTEIGELQWSGDGTPGGNSLVHNGQVRGNYLLTAYYQAGFRVFDITDPTNIVEAGKYDTFRDPNGDGSVQNSIDGGYCGAWNLHSYLPSGNVLVSDATYGLFVFKLEGDDGTTFAPTAAPVPTGTPSASPSEAPFPTAAPATDAPVPAPDCGGNQAPCSANGDCCSNNCKNDSCKGNGRRLGSRRQQGADDWLGGEGGQSSSSV